MLEITIPKAEWWDESKEEFVQFPETTVRLEHSLVSISKWESIHCRAFISKKPKTIEEQLDYIKCMCLDSHVDSTIFDRLTTQNFNEISEYINRPMTAVYFPEETGGASGGSITSEVLYYDMIALGIPFECQKWHLNRLLALIRVCDKKSRPAKKIGRNEILSRNRSLNAARRKKFGTKG